MEFMELEEALADLLRDVDQRRLTLFDPSDLHKIADDLAAMGHPVQEHGQRVQEDHRRVARAVLKVWEDRDDG